MTLIGGLRIWDLTAIGSNELRAPLVLPAKAVSCLDYFPRDDVFVVGTHDVGRVQVWRKGRSGGWEVVHTLSGHLHGIRAVA